MEMEHLSVGNQKHKNHDGAVQSLESVWITEFFALNIENSECKYNFICTYMYYICVHIYVH